MKQSQLALLHCPPLAATPPMSRYHCCWHSAVLPLSRHLPSCCHVAFLPLVVIIVFPSSPSLSYFPPSASRHVSLLALFVVFLSSPCSSCFSPRPVRRVSLLALFVVFLPFSLLTLFIAFPFFSSSSCFSPALFVMPSPSRHISPLALIVVFPSSAFLSCFPLPPPRRLPHRLPLLPLLIAFPCRGSLFMSGFAGPGSCCSPRRSLCWHYAGVAGLFPGIDLLITFAFALCWSCFICPHALALGAVRGVGAQLLTCVRLGFPGSRICCPFTGRVGCLFVCLITGRRHHCRSSDGGGSPPSLSSLAFPTNNGRGYLVVWFQALRSAGVVFVGVCHHSLSSWLEGRGIDKNELRQKS